MPPIDGIYVYGFISEGFKFEILNNSDKVTFGDININDLYYEVPVI